MKIDRKKNAVSGTFWGTIKKLINILFPFITRTVFIGTLGVEYLGLSSLFSSILQVFNLAELGISSALVFSMYKPIVDDDNDKICALMNLYKTCYRVIGLVILGIGLILTPVIPFLINDDIPSDINIYVIYLMNLGATVLSYWLFAYRNSILNAHQRTDIISIIGSVVQVVASSLQLICLIRFHNYYVYLIISILSTIAVNIITSITSKKLYPQFSAKGMLSKAERTEIFAKVRDLFTAKMGAVINHSTDSVVISAFLGLGILAVYQNYYYIVTTVMGFFLVFYEACSAGIANSLIVKGEKENRQLLYNINHCSFFILNFCVTSLVCLYQPFMELWIGKGYLLDFDMVILFAIYLVAEIAPRTIVVFKDAGGIWRNDRFRPLVVSISNLMINIVLVNIIGLKGVLISTIMTLLFIGYPWLIQNINSTLFPLDLKRYLALLVRYSLTMVACGMISYRVCCLFTYDNLIIVLLFRGIICLILPNILFLLLFKNMEETKYFMDMFNNVGKKIRKGYLK